MVSVHCHYQETSLHICIVNIIGFHEDISRDIIGCFHECGRKRDAGLK